MFHVCTSLYRIVCACFTFTFSRYDFSFNHVFSCSFNFLMAICSFCSRFCLRFSCFEWNFSAIVGVVAVVAAAAAAA